MDNLLIQIGADSSDFLLSLGEVGDKTETLGDKLTSVGAIAATAFAGYTASIMGAVYAYRQEELAGQEIQATLQATGGIAGVTARMIDELGEAYSKTTTFSKLQVTQAEAMLITFDEIGKETFPKATQATLDLAQHMGGDAAGAARILGQALQDPMNASARLTRAHIVLTAAQKAQIESMELAGNIAGAQAVIIQAVEDKYGGMAQAAAGGTGQIAVLKNAMEELAANVGEQFAPAISSAATALAGLVNWMSENKAITEFIAGTLAAGAALAGVITGIIGTTIAFEKLAAVTSFLPALQAGLYAAIGEMGLMEAASIALGVSVNALRLSFLGLAGATGIGLLLVAADEIYVHWNSIWPAMQAVYKAFVDTIGGVAQGLSKILNGAFHLDMTQIKAGIAQAAAAFVEGGKSVAQSFSPRVVASAETLNSAATAGAQTQAAENAARLLAARAGQAQLRAWQSQEKAAHNEVVLLEMGNHTAAVIALKKKEAEDLKNLADANFQGSKATLQKDLADIKAQYDAASKAEAKNRTKFEAEAKAGTDKYFKGNATEQKNYLHAHEAQLVASMQTETEAKEAVISQDIQRQIASDNTFLQEQARYGTVYAAINQAMHDTVLTQTETALSSMSAMTQSKNAELAAIGKAASIVDIEIKGAQAAMAVYAGFATIPIIGPELGIIAAAATEIFAQEKAAAVMGFAQGGLVTGGIPGVDSVHMLAQEGELVAPKQNFDEVVNAVANQRAGVSQSAPSQPQQVTVHVQFHGDASRMLQVKNVKDQTLGVYRGT